MIENMLGKYSRILPRHRHVSNVSNYYYVLRIQCVFVCVWVTESIPTPLRQTAIILWLRSILRFLVRNRVKASHKHNNNFDCLLLLIHIYRVLRHSVIQCYRMNRKLETARMLWNSTAHLQTMFSSAILWMELIKTHAIFIMNVSRLANDS